MQYIAKVSHLKYSPYKLRPLADVVRGKRADYAVAWLASCALKRALPIKKMIDSAIANARHLNNIEASQLIIKEIKIDEGPTVKYFKPGALGRANIYRRRSSHMNVTLEVK